MLPQCLLEQRPKSIHFEYLNMFQKGWVRKIIFVTTRSFDNIDLLKAAIGTKKIIFSLIFKNIFRRFLRLDYLIKLVPIKCLN